MTDTLRLFVNLSDGSTIHVESGAEPPIGHVRIDQLPEQYAKVLDRLGARRGQVDAMRDEIDELHRRLAEVEADLADCQDGLL